MTPRDSRLVDEDESSTDDGALVVSAATSPLEEAATTSSRPQENCLAVLPTGGIRLPTKAARPLGLIFDLDGTLVAEPLDADDSGHPGGGGGGGGGGGDCCFAADEVFLRPGARRLLEWCSARGHSFAVWSAAHAGWAHYVSWKLLQPSSDGPSSASSSSPPPRFEFVWDGSRLKRRRRIPRDAHGVETQAAPSEEGASAGPAKSSCCWCGPYRDDCDRCECRRNRVFQCPCRFTKDLSKVWGGGRPGFSRARTLLIENTPQQCLSNYGNAVYVPTYRGDRDDRVLDRLRGLILQMERVEDVRTVGKCGCAVASGGSAGRMLHACRVQSWCQDVDSDADASSVAAHASPTAPAGEKSCLPAQSTSIPQQIPLGWTIHNVDHDRRRP